MSKASEYQPDPKQGEQVIVDVVLADIRERAETGKRKYGTYLETNNGRNPLWDAYQEAIDLAMYLRQALLEQERHLTPLALDGVEVCPICERVHSCFSPCGDCLATRPASKA